jgi:hypothetical protein
MLTHTNPSNWKTWKRLARNTSAVFKSTRVNLSKAGSVSKVSKVESSKPVTRKEPVGEQALSATALKEEASELGAKRPEVAKSRPRTLPKSVPMSNVHEMIKKRSPEVKLVDFGTK